VTEGTDSLTQDAAPESAVTSGAMLRAGREAAGLGIAAVAQQLKLAPRQVTALEDDDFAGLPGRTFIRGFIRNYARLLRLDADEVLAALPDAAAPAPNEQPSLAPTPRPMGELPADENRRPSPARWAIPLALVAVVTVAAIYEMARPPAEPGKPAVVDKPVAAPAPVAPAADAAPAATPGSATTVLPNPLAADDAKAGMAPDNASTRPDAASPSVAGALPTDANSAPIVLTFTGTSWAEVRDATGTPVLSVTGNAGDVHAVGGRPPFDVVLGSAAAVSVTWLGNPFDTAPFTKQNVAKFTLRQAP
jgi:cytoskeleton protein RodZ